MNKEVSKKWIGLSRGTTGRLKRTVEDLEEGKGNEMNERTMKQIVNRFFGKMGQAQKPWVINSRVIGLSQFFLQWLSFDISRGVVKKCLFPWHPDKVRSRMALFPYEEIGVV